MGNKRMRIWLAKRLLEAGMALLPKDTRDLVRDLMIYHVPGALSEERKADIRRLARNSSWH